MTKKRERERKKEKKKDFVGFEIGFIIKNSNKKTKRKPRLDNMSNTICI